VGHGPVLFEERPFLEDAAPLDVRFADEFLQVVVGAEDVLAVAGQDDERLTISYDAGPGADPYIAGTLLAIRRVGSVTGLVRGLDRLL